MKKNLNKINFVYFLTNKQNVKDKYNINICIATYLYMNIRE